MKCKTIVLDAMGVMYRHGDDVGELLLPFLRQQHRDLDPGRVSSLYTEASLGRVSAADFWNKLGVDPVLEDDYLSSYQLMPGLLEFLHGMNTQAASLWCLSNDLSEWSTKLRRAFAVEDFFTGFVISGEIGVRKPDRRIYQALLHHAGCTAPDCVFIDDRTANLDTAHSLGFRTFLFDMSGASSTAEHQAIQSFAELSELLASDHCR